jgi:membrane-associated phospholipid phosphatase
MGGTRRSAILAWLGFALLALLAATGWSVLTDVDAAVADRFHRFGTDHPGWVATMHGVTLLGTGWVLLATNVVAVAICVRTSRYRAALLCAGAVLCTWYSTHLAKSLTSRARPTDAFWPVDGFAFPSGHTSSAAAAAGVAVIAGAPPRPDRSARRRDRLAAAGRAEPNGRRGALGLRRGRRVAASTRLAHGAGRIRRPARAR